VVVATDDERIAKVCREFGAEVVMTSVECPNGTERCNEAITKLGGKYDIVVNIQGDEPLIEPEIIDEVAETLKNSPDAVYRYVTNRLMFSTKQSFLLVVLG
jgi:3-deoxy-manno-octulosonate cytidylyltransferase (CMP-KDO synthetase)